VEHLVVGGGVPRSDARHDVAERAAGVVTSALGRVSSPG
jgi:hypothetical protein